MWRVDCSFLVMKSRHDAEAHERSYHAPIHTEAVGDKERLRHRPRNRERRDHAEPMRKVAPDRWRRASR